ncbi:MAG: SgcJ/EcaC family oxidoreductase [Pseudomonadota bacterium]|nr:SgcJ/EcaC family oxidoreductase [Pseudomonadota bacterium]
MKKQLIQALAAAILVFGPLSSAHAADSNQENIHVVLKTYEQMLNASDVAGVLKLYTQDGVFMAQHNPSAVGINAIEAAYEAVFKAIDLNVKFDIVEIEMVADDWAFARTNSTGTTTINATGDKIAEGNQELFVFQKTDGDEWKIARYSFSTTNPR